ncbi:MAG: D-alanine--D-alanine ligase [Myxococcales bacterium]|nr:D-alanine--D-alanine ligase [Myxococcales bacterium]MCB9643204.1 D-alanine--D-alanine ligase [Myxococcales bacterium]
MNTIDWKTKRIGLLYGGLSSEREVSLKTGEAMASALERRGYQVQRIDVDRNLPVALKEHAIDVAVIALHGKYGEDGCVQGMLELMGIPYTGSGVQASAIAMHKTLSKKLFIAAGLPTPAYHEMTAGELCHTDLASLDCPQGAVVKPPSEGSSVGISICRDDEALQKAAQSFDPATPLLVEAFVDGGELTVAILSDQAAMPLQIVPAEGFYDYQAKYQRHDTQYLCPAPISEALLAETQRLALGAHQALGCRGVTRVDLMLDKEDTLWLLEVNTLPGMTATSLTPKMAAQRGMSFEDLCELILKDASLNR